MFSEVPEKLLWALGVLATAAAMVTRAHAGAAVYTPPQSEACIAAPCLAASPHPVGLAGHEADRR